MKNVTPKAGQVWSNNATEMPYLLDEANIGYTDPVNLHKHFTFQPQNDLEWLAVNEPDWFHPLCNWIRRDDNSRPMYTSDPHHPLIKMYTYYTREQWQNMRYDLGLDEKPKATEQDIQDFADGIVKPLIHYKDTKMIDLKPGDVCDVKSHEEVNAKVIATHDGLTWLALERGGTIVVDIDIVTKHDPRHWLNDLPDAGLFSDSVMSILVSPHNEWNYELINGVCCGLSMLKMPKLTGDEWKLSKISITDLKAWQEQNK